MATKLSVFLAVAVLISMPILAANTGTFRGPRVVVDAPDADSGLLPAPLGIDPIKPKVWVDKDFVISYDEPPPNVNDAKNPSVTVTPTNDYTREKKIAGSIHVIWEEIDEATGMTEIHYSMTGPEREGYPLNWSNDEEREGDRTVSETQKGRANPGDAVSPSIAIDQLGVIHIVWAQMYGDSTWEIHYARSDTNGKNWSSDTGQDPGRDIVISFRDSTTNADSISPPQICVGVNRGAKAPENILYATWAENYGNEIQEVHFSKSFDGGSSWTGVEMDQIISKPNSGKAYSPMIGASGDVGDIVHVSWVQNTGDQKAEPSDEIYYVRSLNYGDDKTWEEEKPISTIGEKPMAIKGISMASGFHDVHVAWSQYLLDDPTIFEMYYAGSKDDGANWTKEYNEVMISSKDGNPVGPPSIAVVDDVTKASPEVHVTWSELDEKSPAQTTEIHTSMTIDPWNPESWTGLKGDIVISWPDENEIANARNPSVSLGFIKDKWFPQIVWEELNVFESKDKADSNTEIHYKPQLYPLDVSVSPSEAGWVTKNPDKLLYEEGEDVEITAHANSGYVFSDWSGDTTGSTNPKTITMNSCMSVTANYDVAYIDLVANTVSGPASCTEHATISISRSFSNTGTIDSGSFRYGLYLSTNNIISTGDLRIYSFSLSQDAGTTNSGSVGVTLPWETYGTFYYGLIADYLYQVTESDEGNNWDASSSTVTITQAELTLTVSTSGSGSVTKSPNQATYHYGDTVMLTAVPDSGWAFDYWSGALGGSSNPDNVTIYGNTAVTAHFKYTQTLTTGWNRVSLPLEQSNTDISVVLSSISTYWTDVVYFDASDGADPWKGYLDGDLTVLTHDMGFWVKVSSGCTLIVQGDSPGTTIINLYTGWNMIGYPAENDGSYTVADLISDTTVICVYQEDWWFFMTELDGTHVLENGEMYWVLVSGSDTTWTITW